MVVKIITLSIIMVKVHKVFFEVQYSGLGLVKRLKYDILVLLERLMRKEYKY